MIAERMKFGFSGKVRGMCGFGTAKEAEPKTFPTTFDLGNPSSVLLVPTHSKESTFVVFVSAFSIVHIFRTSRFPKICYGVVRSDAINMVNLAGRESPMNVQPRQPMGKVSLAINDNSGVSICPSSSGNASSPFPANRCATSKYSGVRTIVQQLTQSFSGNICRIFSSHDAPPVRWDQRRGRVSSACLALSC